MSARTRASRSFLGDDFSDFFFCEGRLEVVAFLLVRLVSGRWISDGLRFASADGSGGC